MATNEFTVDTTPPEKGLLIVGRDFGKVGNCVIFIHFNLIS